MQTRLLIISFLISIFSACTTTVENILPQQGPTMKQVYDHHFTGQSLPKRYDDEASNTDEIEDDSNDVSIIRRPLPADYDLTGYTREANNEINQIFPRLANPTLVIYIYPHLSGSERHPVPGYSSAFSLYEKVEYALPGEMEERY